MRHLLFLAVLFLSCAPSGPLPKETYGECGFNVANPSPLPLDSKLRSVVRRYRTSNALTRALTRANLQRIDSFTLRDFAHRAGVFAMREKNREWVEDGLSAVAMIKDDEDEQMYTATLAVLHRAARRAGADPAAMFEKAAELADPDVAPGIRKFAAMREVDKALSKFLLAELPTGIVGRGIDPFTPRHDLVRVMFEISAMLERDRYHPCNLVIHDRLPETWVEGAEADLRTSRGVVRVETAALETLWVWVTEMADERAAENLLAAWKRGREESDRPSLAIARGNLFCLMVSPEPEMHETPQTLQRFAPQLERILDATLAR